MTTIPTFARRGQSRGAVLFVALIMLILLTLLGIAAMQVTTLQERMSGNFRIQRYSFERAEGRMAQARNTLSDPVSKPDAAPRKWIELARAMDDDGNPISSEFTSPWSEWTSNAIKRIEPQYQIAMRDPGNANSCQWRGTAVMDDPNKKVCFYVVSAQEKDPVSEPESAAWSSVQTHYVF